MTRKPLRSYHHVWLSVHPHRDEEWLREKLIEGFDIHHVDGDHSNDAAGNLILVEAADHMRLHGVLLREGIKGWRLRNAQKSAERNRLRAKPAPNSHRVDIPFDDASIKAFLSRIGRC